MVKSTRRISGEYGSRVIKFLYKRLLSSWPRPKSMVGLVRTGFSLVAIVLLIAIIFAVYSLDQLQQQSEYTVRNGVQLTRLSRQLSTIIPAMERNARQYLILNEPALLDSYKDHEQNFLTTLNKIEDLEITALADIQFAEMRAASKAIYKVILPRKTNESRTLNSDFPPFQLLREQAREISNQANVFIETELNKLQQTTIDTGRFLLLSNAALIPAAVLLVIIFTTLITRPIKQIDAVIKRLGEGHFDEPVKINSPSTEMHVLASQLDWLRCRILELENEKNQFLQSMSHELKTPLASIREGTDLLLDGTAGRLSVQQHEIVDILYESSIDLQALIDNLLNFTAWQKWSPEVQLTEFDLSALVRNVVNRHLLIIDNKKLDIITTAEPVTILADRERLRLALDNLIANAIKFSPKEGTVTILSANNKSHVEISVMDEGPGIPESERAHIFTPFYQGEINQEIPIRGTGIGLSVVRNSILAHDGEVRILDNNPSGAYFQIIIPQPE